MKEDTLFRKLLADGEGIGEDRRLQQVASFFRENRNNSDFKVLEAVKVSKSLELIDLSMLKQKKIAHMNQVQADEFNGLAETIERQIELMYERMSEAKSNLVAAKVVKKNRQEYRKLVKIIDKTPSRSETTRKLGEIRDELLRQHDRQKVLEAKLADRRNHLQAFNIIISNFQRFTTEDDFDMSTDVAVTDNDDEDDTVSLDKNYDDPK